MTDERLTHLRREFDLAFARPAAGAAAATEGLVIVGLNGAGYAIRVRELSGLSTVRKIVAVPNGAPGLLGLCGVRGALVPVYSLLSVMTGAAPERSARWLLFRGEGADVVGLVVAEYEGYVDVPRASVHAVPESEGRGAFVKEIARHGGRSFGVIDLSEVVRVITQRLGVTEGTRGH